MRIGTAWTDITPEQPLALLGQMHQRLAERTRDPLTANAVAIENEDQRVVVVSCDLCVPPDALVEGVRRRCERQWGLPPARLLLAATHTHLGPRSVPQPDSPPAQRQYNEQLQEKVAAVVGDALEDLEDAQLLAGQSELEHMGWNRRGRHHDQNHADMYWGSWKDGFIEPDGPRDGSVPVIWARRADGSIKAVLTGFTTHPNCCESERFYSADMVGATRRTIRKLLGQEVGVVYLTGAAGNTAPSILADNPDNRQPWRGEAGLERSGAYLGAEIVKVIMGQVDPMPDPVVHLASTTLQVPMRPWPDHFDPEKTCPAGPTRDRYLKSRDQWDQWMAQGSPVAVELNVLRLGEAAICTNPTELFVELGLAIKADSPASLTMISELTNGSCGYVPTADAFERGGYATWNASTSKLVHDAGDRIVQASRALLQDAFASTPTPSGA